MTDGLTTQPTPTSRENQTMTHIPTDDYYCAQRDSDGNIRLNCGRGLLIADTADTRADVQGWFDNAGSPRWAANYRSALNLFDQETPGAIPPEELTAIFTAATAASKAALEGDPGFTPNGTSLTTQELTALHQAAGLQAVATSAVKRAMRRGYQDGNVTMIASDELAALRGHSDVAREARSVLEGEEAANAAMYRILYNRRFGEGHPEENVSSKVLWELRYEAKATLDAVFQRTWVPAAAAEAVEAEVVVSAPAVSDRAVDVTIPELPGTVSLWTPELAELSKVGTRSLNFQAEDRLAAFTAQHPQGEFNLVVQTDGNLRASRVYRRFDYSQVEWKFLDIESGVESERGYVWADLAILMFRDRKTEFIAIDTIGAVPITGAVLATLTPGSIVRVTSEGAPDIFQKFGHDWVNLVEGLDESYVENYFERQFECSLLWAAPTA